MLQEADERAVEVGLMRGELMVHAEDGGEELGVASKSPGEPTGRPITVTSGATSRDTKPDRTVARCGWRASRSPCEAKVWSQLQTKPAHDCSVAQCAPSRPAIAYRRRTGVERPQMVPVVPVVRVGRHRPAQIVLVA
jgi:hypothetical protein